jgi:ferritin-like metal-binding protein YciE
MEKLARKNKDKVIDLLAERLSFERASVKLWDKVLERMHALSEGRPRDGGGDYTTYGQSGYAGDASRGMSEDIRREQRSADREERGGRAADAAAVAEMLPHMRAYRDQEQEHEEWLEDCIRRLGGDPKRTTELAKLAEREAAGIQAVIMKDPELPHLFHALLAAEHVDDAGWDLLAGLAVEAGDLDAKQEFERRLHEEEQHLAYLREALRTFSAREILDERLGAPEPHGESPSP